MIYTRFHDPVSIIRIATAKDIRAILRHRPTVEESRRLADHMLWVVRYETDSCGQENEKQEAVYDLGDLRADKGLAEIYDTLGKVAPALADYFK